MALNALPNMDQERGTVPPPAHGCGVRTLKSSSQTHHAKYNSRQEQIVHLKSRHQPKKVRWKRRKLRVADKNSRDP